MGNSQSPSSHRDPRFASSSRAFSHTELEALKSLHASLAAQSQSKGPYVSPSVFKNYFGLHGPLGDRMFDLVTQQRKDQNLTFEDLVIAKGIYEKGTKDEIEEFIYQLLDVYGDGIVGSAHHETVNIFLNAAKFAKQDEGHAEESLSFEDFRTWCTLLPSVRKFLGSLLIPPNLGRPGSQVPRLLHLENIDPNMILLKKVYAWHIGGILPQHDLEEWKLLYHSSVNGQSFSTFLGNVSKDKGQTVLIIKDKEGYVYGGYASQPWERHGDFYGDLKSFLFQLYPTASIFRPTGANTNLQWCAVNFSSASIPNGIGFGGKVNHLGLFLSATLDQGHTFSCTTFGSPCLSKTNQIYPEVIEGWGVVTKVPDERKHDGGKGTVLERFKEDRHMLNMVGLANASE
ncbi:TLD domain-containing protein 1 isoform X2 [Prunus yedoensis var. nudiflora]|uniref:TLD domain-containing protein 1 isoform X2 n=1 Tax=Prunus yedoensis var. nudiflora TaxID=2094558 RepID=A0A314UI71_PRUYE|nr:TLD domain-containing protein 1 isoform X2 [Prunus yedoensis var. nudiflora]